MIDFKDLPNFQSGKQPYAIAISGAAETGHCSVTAFDDTVKIARRGMILVTGATSGVPYWAARAAKEAGGFVLGLSPAASRAHHVKTYRLPTDYHDLIIYTGFDYAGRDLLVSRAADAVITICGRTGTLHEFTTSFEDGLPQGVLLGSGGVADMLPDILSASHRGNRTVVFERDPLALVASLVAAIDAERARLDAVAEGRLDASSDAP
jgi:uncharacterized protein (TIGR00725 family)